VFARSWIFVAHESEVAQGGDYKVARIGRQPVIVTRSADDGAVHVMFNRCRHRGSAVCQREFGSANHFRCAYHGWTYRSNGSLVGVPFADGYGPEFDKSKMGLVHVARVEDYRGFIFACLDPEAPPLEEYLGHARPFIDFVANLPGGIELSARAHKLEYEGNWKLQLENTIDCYHFSFTHRSWLDILKARGQQTNFPQNVANNEEWRTIDFGGGHAAHEYGPLERSAAGAGVTNFSTGELLPFNLVIFPNLGFVGSHVRVVNPVSATRTQVLLYPIVPRAFDAAKRAEVLRSHEAFYGAAGAGSDDDIEVGFDRVMGGLQADMTGEDWVLMSRGVGREMVDAATGIRYGRSADELPQRGFYRRWQSLVAGELDG
jgi:phenylpropionate dioxygenase-like ring-hydroxylating dioxygenase large terminal subunit